MKPSSSNSGLVLLAIVAICTGGCFDFQGAWKREHPAFLAMMEVIHQDPVVVEQLGEPIAPEIPQGYFDSAGGSAAFKFQLTGARQVAEGAADLRRTESGEWEVVLAWVLNQRGEEILLVEDGAKVALQPAVATD